MRVLLAVSFLCFSLLFTAASAQEPSAEQVQQQIENQLRHMLSPKGRLGLEADQLGSFRSIWNGQGTWMPLSIMLRAGGDVQLGLTEEQKKRLAPFYRGQDMGGEAGQRLRANPTPEYIQAIQAVQAAELPDDPFFERATEEQKNAWRSAQADAIGLLVSVMQTEVMETLTPEQMLQVRKLEMQLMPALGIPFPSMFDPLDLTDDQKEEMNSIADEMKAEFDRLVMEEALLKGERVSATVELLKGKSFASFEELQKSRQEAFRQFVPGDAIRKKAVDLQERGIKFVTLLQNRLMDVLTDEQLDRMQQIMDESPEFVKQVLAEFKATQERQKQTPTYVPGPDSWRPGMPLPVQVKEQRKSGNFPRPRQEQKPEVP